MVVSLRYLTACIAQRSSLCMHDRPGKQTFLCILQYAVTAFVFPIKTCRLQRGFQFGLLTLPNLKA
jgi:hypothetical protein